MKEYRDKIYALENPTFEEIQRIARQELKNLSENKKNDIWYSLDRGTRLIEDHWQLCMYLHSFGSMHQAKLLDSFKRLPNSLIENPFDVIDWGCGQGIGVITLLDYLRETNNGINNIQSITLIEPSKVALERARLHVNVCTEGLCEVQTISSFFENIKAEQIYSKRNRPVLHIFSNILDVVDIDLKLLSKLIDSTVSIQHYLLCVGPLNPNNQRIDAFLNYFDDNSIKSLYKFETSRLKEGEKWTYKSRIVKLEPNPNGHLIPIDYYPPVQFHASYEINVSREIQRHLHTTLTNRLNTFEVVAPFDLGACVYDDVHPILAVLNNIIVRGLPTRASIFIESVIQTAHNLTERQVENGAIAFPFRDYKMKQILVEKIDQIDNLTIDLCKKENHILTELLLTPIAVARFQKVLVEAIITGHLDIKKDSWEILVHEHDVPFAAIALRDFEELFSHLTNLSDGYEHFKLPQIALSVISNKAFQNSPLHLENQIFEEDNIPPFIKSKVFDFVLTLSMFEDITNAIDSFSKFKTFNNCYFNIRNATHIRTNRTIYTSDLIKYKPLVSKSSQGNYIESTEQKQHLKYFIQLLFRKEVFRSGQLPILDRALQNQPVIGLLPTGGGKSLTYQLAGLLQPGVTLIIDPLKSLMKDQHDGLINSGIDTSGYINSTLSSKERENVEKALESSRLQFIFLSPERLSIASFRERLKNMHSYNVYFSYGVIDEVHCVSEWGHDFRFSYLHLGRNLYNYVKTKHGNISLLGLTATASFDVLADVERELTGNGAFELDADAIVRYENTNRLELQYKIESIPVKFAEDTFYDPQKQMALHLPRAINITNQWTPFESKSTFLKNYLLQVPEYIQELQLDENIDLITKAYYERNGENLAEERNLGVEMPLNFYQDQEKYQQAGIIFCPHVNSTPLSVKVNTDILKKELTHNIGSFTGSDDDNSSMDNLEKFRDNKLPIMIATKAFGMGIDKPNVRFTINMNYSSSLESFVQEAGRAGRDRKMALSIILISDYHLVKLDRNYSGDFPINIIRNRWFHAKEFDEIVSYYKLVIPKDQLLYATPSSDIVRLFCAKDNKMFSFNQCSPECSSFSSCKLKLVDEELKGWKAENELERGLLELDLNITKKHFQYLNADYESVMYFFVQAFKGDLEEKKYLNGLLNIFDVELGNDSFGNFERNNGFLQQLENTPIGETLFVRFPYSDENFADLSKAVYRMCCIELIEDFTQDYLKKQLNIVMTRKKNGDYYKGLKRFLLRYYTNDRAELEIKKVKKRPLKGSHSKLITEIYQCLAYLTEFVYDKISEKRKRAIDDIRNFCLEGIDSSIPWTKLNENLKDSLYFYFNSKYARTDYITDAGEPFSLVIDTDRGKESSEYIIRKYIRVIEDDVIGNGTPIDNVRHLYGAIRLISRSLTDQNPSLSILESFCLIYLGLKDNENLKNQFQARFFEGFIELANRMHNDDEFWNLLEDFIIIIQSYLENEDMSHIPNNLVLIIHGKTLNSITQKYLNNYE